MTDIVERLRQCDENFDLVQEAANEIERLRDEIMRLRVSMKALIHTWDDDRGIEHMVEAFDRARAALKESSLSDKEGTLRMMASGRWAVYRPGRLPVEITSGESFRVDVGGELKLTRMEYDHADRRYYSIDGYPLRDGLHAAIGEHE
jgi:hypothetical protein